MDQNELTIRIFMLGSALVVGLDAMKSAGRVRVGLWIFTVLLLAAGVFWSPIAAWSPRLATTVGSVAAAPLSWFILAALAYALFRLGPFVKRSPKTGADVTATDDTPTFDAAAWESIRRHAKQIVALEKSQQELLASNSALLQKVRQNDAALEELTKALNSATYDLGELEAAEKSLIKDVVRLGQNTMAICRRQLFQHYLDELRAFDQEQREAWGELTKAYADPAPFDSPQWLARHGAALKAWEGATGKVLQLLKDIWGEEPAPLSHPNYDRNPYAPVPMDELLEDPAKRQEYRRTFDQQQTYIQHFEANDRDVRGQINQSINWIFSSAGSRKRP